MQSAIERYAEEIEWGVIEIDKHEESDNRDEYHYLLDILRVRCTPDALEYFDRHLWGNIRIVSLAESVSVSKNEDEALKERCYKLEMMLGTIKKILN